MNPESSDLSLRESYQNGFDKKMEKKLSFLSKST